MEDYIYLENSVLGRIVYKFKMKSVFLLFKKLFKEIQFFYLDKKSSIQTFNFYSLILRN